jgi:hypothetical protein
MRKYLRTERGERIDQPDFQHAADATPRESQDDLIDGMLIGRSRDGVTPPRSFILKGFAMDSPDEPNKVVRVTRGDGAAILPYREKGEVRYGFLVVGGDASKSYSIASYTAGVEYGIFIRAELRDADFQNRPFWNAVGTPGEYPRSIATRRAEGWQLAIEQVSPGPEWFQIGSVDYDTMAFTDLRNFMFEGQDANAHAVVDSEWGADATDRDDDRPSYGVFGVFRAIRAIQRQVQDIIGGAAKWWQDPQAGNANGSGARSLTQLNSEKLARNGSQTMTGSLLPNVHEALDLGADGSAGWRNVFFKNIWMSGVFSGNLVPSGNDAWNIGAVGAEWRDFHVKKIIISDTVTGDILPNSTGTYDLGSTLKRFAELHVTDAYVGDWQIADNKIEYTGSGGVNYLLYLGTGEGAANRGAFQSSPNLGNGLNTALVEIFAGDTGTGRIKLQGTSNRLAKWCEGQNGWFVRTITVNLTGSAVSAGGTVGGSHSFSAPTGININHTTAIIAGVDIIYGGSIPEEDNLAMRVELSSADNMVVVGFSNWSGSAKPSSDRSYALRILFMALP